ncbi:MAG TPA: NfeD family protein [Candidatus Limnocylindria bacterium]|nr:NfeD family protein [Candidatus Limnocylindria bacterium]
MNLIYFWLTVAVGSLMLELSSFGLFFFFSFFVGGLVAAGVSTFSDEFMLQALTFLFSTLCSFGILRWWVHKEKGHGHKTNVYALQGKDAVVQTDIAPYGQGQVKVGGELWSARSRESKVLLAGCVVEIVEVSGSYVVVKSCN